MRKPSRFSISVAMVATLAPSLSALQEAPQDLADMSIEDLMKIDVTSVSKGSRKLLDVPAAVTVIRGEELRRSGATTLPDALRSVPGIHVAQQSSSTWIVASRGFSDLYANKLLVLIDGRSVYTPLFSGVLWSAQGTVLEDVERIEVIRGPGATVWGANAVNGVINVITKSSTQTRGTLVQAGAGTHEQGFGTLRHGGILGEDVAYRAYGQYFSRDAFSSGADDWSGAEAGFRVDAKAGDRDAFLFTGDWIRNDCNGRQTVVNFAPPSLVTFDGPTLHAGLSALARWEHTASDSASLRAQLYWHHSELDSPILEETRDTYDLDLQQRFRWESQELTFGAGYRWTRNEVDNTPTLILDPDHRSDGLVSAFVQDEVKLSDAVLLTLGSKFEYNGYTGFEWQPGARLLVKPHERHSVWLSAARAVRTPSQAESDMTLNRTFDTSSGFPVLAVVHGNDDLESERLIALEAGYRTQPLDSFSFDLALYCNRYDNLRSTEVGALDPSTAGFGYLTQHLGFDNKMEGITYGFEATATWQAAEGLRLAGSYAFLHMNLRLESDSTDDLPPNLGTDHEYEHASPRGMASFRASVDLEKDVDIDLLGRWVSVLSGPDVDAYVELDARVAWRFHRRAELALVGQNLLHRSHTESNTSALGDEASDVKRGVYLSLTWRF